MDGLIGIDKVILVSKVKIVEIVGLEDRLNLAVFVGFTLLVQVSIGLDNSAMSLALAKKNKVLLPNRIK